jgi:hypothetical protein
MSIFKSIWLKEKCPRCSGALMIEREECGRLAIKCLMCSRTINPDDIAPAPPAEFTERAATQ